jgi:hypothetical protein
MSDNSHTPPVAPAGQPATPGQGQPEPAPQGAPDPNKVFNEARSLFDKYVDARLKKLANAFDETPSAPPAQAVMGGQSPQGQPPNAETQWAKNVEAVFGMTLDPSDQEASLLIEGETPVEYKRNYIEALKAKKARLQAATPAAPPPAPSTTPTTTGGQGAPVPKPDAMERYRKAIAQPGLTKDQKLNIRDKFRREEHLPI